MSAWVGACATQKGLDASVSRGGAGGNSAGSAGDAGSAGGAGEGGGTSGSSSGGAGAMGGGGPCDGVQCDMPPANTCADADNLLVYAAPGACDAGNCSYSSSTKPCPGGCANGACSGDPCIGVTCNTPPASVCADANNLTVYDPPGNCNAGNCEYGSHTEFCPGGCAMGSCTGDPCIGVTCNTPPANYCSGPNELTVGDTPGTCTNGNCSYTSHTEFCSFGCSGGACDGDPCAGVTCNSPDAPYCVDANTKRTFASAGTCTDGNCSYAPTDANCPYGCQDGVCRECSGNTDCGSGKWCDNFVCKTCDDNAHCGASCTDCAASGDVCNAAGTACVGCVNDIDCGSGNWCNGSTCAACDTAAHCGPSCAACTGATPECAGGSCLCTPTSCPTNQTCSGGQCAVCATSSSCGPSCTACGGATPHCKAAGSTSSCVECTTNAHCGTDEVCDSSGSCVPDGCPPPAVACANGSESRDRCSGARTISRLDASDSSGYLVSSDTCNAHDRFDDSGSCYDAGYDHTYRIYLRQAESIQISLNTSWGCQSSFWDATIKLYSNAGCNDTACTNKVICDDYFEGTKNYTAPHDGWYIIVVDGSTAFDDEGDYVLGVKLTCGPAGCGCSS